jgi:hypothetical protein
MRTVLAATALAALLAAPPPADGQDPTAPAPPATGGNPFARLMLLPDVSLIGSFAAAWNDWNVGEQSPRTGPYAPDPNRLAFLFEEAELGLQAVVDPYVRADVFISFTPDGVSVEEAYVTTLSLPAGLQLKAGQLFSPFGRENGQHPHVWEFVDSSLARVRLLAPEVLSGPGVSLGWLTPLPWYSEIVVAAQSTAVTEGGPDALTGLARLLQYFTVGDATTLGLGLSGALRDDAPGVLRKLGGADLYLRIRPPDVRAWLAVTSEVFLQQIGSGATDWGWYAQAFWREGPRWGAGIRWDDAPTAPTSLAGPGRELRLSGVGTFLPSEFLRLRAQVGYDWLPHRQGGVAALLALEFAIGAHGAHPF